MGGSTLFESARVALAEGDVPTAVARLRDAVVAGPNPSARQLLGGLLFADDDLAGARREWEVAFREWKDAGEPREAARVAADLADLHASGLGNRAAGAGWVSRGRRLLARVGRCVEDGYLYLATVACGTDDVGRLEEAASTALELALEFGDPELEVRALADAGYALVVQGRTTEGFARLDEAMAALSAGEVQSPSTAGKTFCALLSACDRSGEFARAEEWARVIYDELSLITGGRSRVMYGHCRQVYGSVLCAAGRWQEGEVALLDALGPRGTAYVVHHSDAAACLASLRLLQGRVEEAGALLRPYEDRACACAPLAQVHLLTGDADVAAAVARRGLDAVTGDTLRTAALHSLLVEIDLARHDLTAAAADADALALLTEATDCRPLRAEAAIARGRIAAARRDAAAAMACFEEARSCVDAAERPLLAGVVSLELAQALAETGDRGAAVDHARLALGIFDELGAPLLSDRTEALLRSLGAHGRSAVRRSGTAVATLTERERQVLDLIREGLTNAEIGKRLFISAKTAEHHVGRLLAKLGVRTRAEAAAVATAASLTPNTP